jgi:hypothetical protein
MITSFNAVFVVLWDGEHLSRDLMADDAWIRNQRVGAAERTNIRAADPGGSNFNQRLANLRLEPATR